MQKFNIGDKVSVRGYPGRTYEVVNLLNGTIYELKDQKTGFKARADVSIMTKKLDIGLDAFDVDFSFEEPQSDIDPCTIGGHIKSEQPMRLKETFPNFSHYCTKCGKALANEPETWI